MNGPALDADTLKTHYDTHGYVIIPGLFENAHQLDALDQAAARAISKTREGSWMQRRTVGKQFPPFDTTSQRPDVWGVQHIMHPDLAEPEFAKWYAGDELCSVARILLGCADDDLQMELFNILINPQSHDFALRWHRDDVRENASAEEEVEALNKWHHGVQWNTALYDDDALFVVPGSHSTARTPEQRTQSSTMEPPADPMTMPGVLRVELTRGDTVFYNNNILHCAAYSSVKQRATLHGCMGDARGGSVRARNILQHGLGWMREDKFSHSLTNDRGRKMLDKLIAMDDAARELHGDNVVYSQDG
ncbi:hypothetical protein BKA62DRAFT_645473 [Auriculariales sp. MPI-PUGE-AT-0066]|nr:hypothetical protein BKA62DRAFT_645473 [Auriculariales sp. MPI-PUGE-AT-0066]